MSKLKKINYVVVVVISLLTLFVLATYNLPVLEASNEKLNDDLIEVKNITYKIFGDIDIDTIEYLYGLNNSQDYIYVNFCDGGYAIYFKETFELMEYSLNNNLNYDSLSSKKYYAGPSNYFIKDNNEFVNITTGDKLILSKTEIEEYEQQKNNFLALSNNAKTDILSGSTDDITGNISFTDNKTDNSSPKFDKENLILANPPGSINSTYIPNYEYFLINPTHGTNYHGTCGSVAAQLLLSYNNYYNDRRIILPEYLNGDWQNNDDDIFNISNYRNPQNNMNVCYNPIDLTDQIAGSNDNYYKYIIDIIEPKSVECICTIIDITINGDKAIIEKTIKYPDGREEKLDKVIREAKPGEKTSHEVEHTHTGSSLNEVINGLEEILMSRISSDQFKVSSSMLLSSPKTIKNEIDNGRPVIIGMSKVLGSIDHWVVGYGYQDYIFSDGSGTYSGYVVHMGWDENQNTTWINESWCASCITLKLNHEHKFETIKKYDDLNVEIRCDCGYRTIDNIFDVKDGKIINCKYQLSETYSIPSEIGGEKIISIEKGAFKNQKNLKNLRIPNTVINIAPNAFENCSNLVNVDLSINLVSIGSSAFRGCNNLLHISIPNNVTTIASNAFENCSNLKTIKLSSRLNSISESLFKGCLKLESVIIPSSVGYIGANAFENCESLNKVNIQREMFNITNLSENVFLGCNETLEIIVPMNRLAEYKNNGYWILYKDKIKSAYNNYPEIELNCLSQYEESITINYGYNKLLELNVKCAKSYIISATTLSNIKMNIYNSSMTLSSSGEKFINIYLSPGVYYVDLEFLEESENNEIVLCFNLRWPNEGEQILNGENNYDLSHLHKVEDDKYKKGMHYNNVNGAGFYKFSIYPVGSIVIYEDNNRSNRLNKVDVLSQNAVINENINSICIYLPRSGYYYIDIVFSTNEFSSFYMEVEREINQNIDIFEQNNIVIEKDFTIGKNINNLGDYVKKINIKQTGNFEISFSYSGEQEENIIIFLIKIDYDEYIDKNSLNLIFSDTLNNNYDSLTLNMNLIEGSYYIGYFNLIDGEILDIHLNRKTNEISNAMHNALITDPDFMTECGSQINIIEMNKEIKSYRGSTITKGFTRYIYLDTSYNIPPSRLEYNWYSSNESVATVTKYGTVLGIKEGTVNILAVLKSDPTKTFIKSFTIINDEETDLLVIHNIYKVKYANLNNSKFKFDISKINCPYPWIQNYIWEINTDCHNSNIIVTMDHFGKITVNGTGCFTLNGIYNINSRVKLVIHFVIE